MHLSSFEFSRQKFFREKKAPTAFTCSSGVIIIIWRKATCRPRGFLPSRSKNSILCWNRVRTVKLHLANKRNGKINPATISPTPLFHLAYNGRVEHIGAIRQCSAIRKEIHRQFPPTATTENKTETALSFQRFFETFLGNFFGVLNKTALKHWSGTLPNLISRPQRK